MNRRYYQPIPCGATLPLDNPHAFSVSMPTYQDVADYEEERNAIFERITSAYPRILFHPYVKKAAQFIRTERKLDPAGVCYILPSLNSAQHVAKLSGTSPQFYEYEDYALAYFPDPTPDSPADYYAFMKHCGYMIYSREAEDFLRSHGMELPVWEEKYNDTDPEEQILTVLEQGYGASEITLCGSGMNAIYAAYAAIKETVSAERDIFVQYGWIYADSIHILRKCSNEFHQIGRVTDFAKLEAYLADNGDRVAAVMTETISNPLLQTPDLPVLASLARQYGFTVILDNTFATPWNVSVAPYADIIVESLTKFASGKGDCMGGAIIVPEQSQLTEMAKKALGKFVVPLKGRDLQRLGLTISGYRERMKQVNINSAVLVDYLDHHPQVKDVYHVYADTSCENYRKIAKGKDRYGGVISFVVDGDFQTFYDHLALPKGPSLGCDFPLAMSYTLLAHWDLVNEAEQRTLKEQGLSPWLIRLSVGEDSPQLIIAAMEKAFQALSL
ncbi:PLP-dependent transferase [uncultured Desulfuromusa sp.]|uniref:PLP-dependent transferase n=1 Tax=uncultured Desulfuromusa sp. TaxID=219183 RepID=UPI002AA62074|nr:PLP-dependent transferase [uncultured Desulfuromusa sp.]